MGREGEEERSDVEEGRKYLAGEKQKWGVANGARAIFRHAEAQHAYLQALHRAA